MNEVGGTLTFKVFKMKNLFQAALFEGSKFIRHKNFQFFTKSFNKIRPFHIKIPTLQRLKSDL